MDKANYNSLWKLLNVCCCFLLKENSPEKVMFPGRTQITILTRKFQEMENGKINEYFIFSALCFQLKKVERKTQIDSWELSTSLGIVFCFHVL